MTFNVVQVILAILLIVCILLQRRGAGLSATFGGDSSSYSTRRGLERTIFYATIVLAFLFFGSMVVRFLV